MNSPSLNGNWIDFLVISVFIFYIATSWGRGLLFGMLDLFGFGLSFVIALKSYSWVGSLLISNFSLTRGIANALGFLISGISFEFIYSFMFSVFVKKLYPKIISGLKNKKTLKILLISNKFLGFIPALGEAVVFTAFILTLLVTLPIQGRIKKDIVTSKIGSVLISNTQGVERKLNNIFGEAVTETLTFLTINPNPSSNEMVELGFFEKNGVIDKQAEDSMLTLVNIERKKNNLHPLRISQRLTDLAREYAADMFERGYFSHYDLEGRSPFERMSQANIEFVAAGENLALAPNVVLAHQGLMNSEGHRENILSSDFRQIGIGAIDGGIYGIMFVQEFTD